MCGKKYIYNIEQANFYIHEGCRVLETGIHNITGKIFYVFNWEETQQAYNRWVTRKY